MKILNLRRLLMGSMAVLLLFVATAYVNSSSKLHAAEAKAVKVAKPQTVNEWWFWSVSGVTTCEQWVRLANQRPYSCVSCAPKYYWSGTLAVNTVMYYDAALFSHIAAGIYFSYGPPGYGPTYYRIVVDATGKVTSISTCI